MEADDKYLDLRALNDYCMIAVPTLRDHIRRDGLPCFKVRGKILVKRLEFDAWMESHRLDRYQIKQIASDSLAKLKGKSDR